MANKSHWSKMYGSSLGKQSCAAAVSFGNSYFLENIVIFSFLNSNLILNWTSKTREVHASTTLMKESKS